MTMAYTHIFHALYEKGGFETSPESMLARKVGVEIWPTAYKADTAVTTIRILCCSASRKSCVVRITLMNTGICIAGCHNLVRARTKEVLCRVTRSYWARVPGWLTKLVTFRLASTNAAKVRLAIALLRAWLPKIKGASQLL